ncbi:hypothetical protein ACVWWO_007407 [Bradyrhizobium sp. F1.13.1]
MTNPREVLRVRVFLIASSPLFLALIHVLLKRDFEMTCEACNNKAYLICTRSDGRRAVERCDMCAADCLSDEQAAILARYDGIACAESYPCYVKEKQ